MPWVLMVMFMTPAGDAEFKTRAYPTLEACLAAGSELVLNYFESSEGTRLEVKCDGV
tara:strand:+ start:88 stop:258 length:171 start_codon:yes stop_codon:yes gene_type:complete